jgi:hypothetical protein
MGIGPLSINSTYGTRQGGRFKTNKAQDWTCSVFHLLDTEEYKAQFKQLREHFDPTKHAYKVDLVANYPAQLYFNKQGLVSSKTIDQSNWEKSIIDCFFLPKFFGAQSPAGCDNLNMDDRFITDLSSCKRPSDEGHSLVVTITVVDLLRSQRPL